MSAAERVRAAYAAIAAADRPEVWISLRPENEALAEAAVVDAQVAVGERLPLAGLTAAVKDNIDVVGLPTTADAPSYSYLPERDATCVGRLRAAGAVILGKTNMDQFATGLVGTRSPYGAVRNAVDLARISGGSSSGSAVAVALGLADIALGTDTGGSGRVPAALNGVVGAKPTRGLIPATGVVPACRTLDCVTVFARSLSLARRMVMVMSGPDGRDPLARPRQAATGGCHYAGLIGTSLDPTVARIILDSAGCTAAQYFTDRERLDFLVARTAETLSDFNALLTPTTTGHPSLAEAMADPIGVNARLGRFTNFTNLLDMAAVAVPSGTVRGLPFGIMLSGSDLWAGERHGHGTGAAGQQFQAAVVIGVVVGAVGQHGPRRLTAQSSSCFRVSR